MREATLLQAIRMAERFIEAAEAARKRVAKDGNFLFYTGCKETAAAKRVSLDLTRMLAEMRKSS